MTVDVVIHLTSPPTVALNLTGNQLGVNLDQSNSLAISLTNVEDVGQTIAVNTEDAHVVLAGPGGSVAFDSEVPPDIVVELGPLIKGDRGPTGATGATGPTGPMGPSGIDGAVPTFLPQGATYTVAQNYQVLFSSPIDAEGLLVLDGLLIEVI